MGVQPPSTLPTLCIDPLNPLLMLVLSPTGAAPSAKRRRGLKRDGMTK